MDTTRTLLASLFAAAVAVPAAAQPATPPATRMFVMPAMPAMPAFPAIAGWRESADDRADDLYDRARDLIEQGKYDSAVSDLDRLIALKSKRTDAAMYWKAYSLAKLGQRDAALRSLADLQKRFGDSRWSRDARSLELEVRQASGQTVTPESQNDDELKLLALRGIMQSDPEQALPVIEKMLTGTNSPKVKDRALFVLSQSRGAPARNIIANIAKGSANPDLQLKAIQYLGIMSGPDNRQLLSDVYNSSPDPAVKKRILRSFMVAGDRERLLAVAKTESGPDLRGEAVQLLGVMRAGAELNELYQSESSADVKKRIIQAMFVGNQVDKVAELAKGERDPELRKAAIHNLGLMKSAGTAETLASIYGSDSSSDVRKAVVHALFLQNNAKALIDLARAEKSPDMKKEIVFRLSIMTSKEATEYLMELLK